MEEGVELEEGENEEGEDEEGINIGQNEMADDYTVDELFRMGKKMISQGKKLFLTIKEYFIEPFCIFSTTKECLNLF